MSEEKMKKLVLMMAERTLRKISCDNVGGRPRATCQCDSCELSRLACELLEFDFEFYFEPPSKYY